MYVDAAKYKSAFERIRNIVGQESSLDKIVADFVKVEDQNFALFNYVTEMNNQVTHESALWERLIKDLAGLGKVDFDPGYFTILFSSPADYIISIILS